jgi:hypothetical protein
VSSWLRAARRSPVRPGSDRFPAVQLLVFTTVALCALVIGYAIGLGGAVSALIFLAIVFTGIFIRVTQPLMDLFRT